MAETTTQLPEIDVDSADERPTLCAFLDYHRAVLARKAEGLTDAQARLAPCPPSDMSMLGLIRHMADVERSWAQRGFAGTDAPPIFYGDAHPDADPDGDFHAPPSATLDEALAAFWAEIEAADVVYDEGELDDIVRGEGGDESLRWIYVHLIEEYARHCGHADLIRQAIDGTTGD